MFIWDSITIITTAGAVISLLYLFTKKDLKEVKTHFNTKNWIKNLATLILLIVFLTQTPGLKRLAETFQSRVPTCISFSWYSELLIITIFSYVFIKVFQERMLVSEFFRMIFEYFIIFLIINCFPINFSLAITLFNIVILLISVFSNHYSVLKKENIDNVRSILTTIHCIPANQLRKDKTTLLTDFNEVIRTIKIRNNGDSFLTELEELYEKLDNLGNLELKKNASKLNDIQKQAKELEIKYHRESMSYDPFRRSSISTTLFFKAKGKKFAYAPFIDEPFTKAALNNYHNQNDLKELKSMLHKMQKELYKINDNKNS